MLKKIQRGFTLLELLIVITILAILTLVVVLFINPVEMLKKSRDVQRMSDLSTLNAAISLYLQDSTSNALTGCAANAATVASATSTYQKISIPSGTYGVAYASSSATNYMLNDSNGWVPVNFAGVSSGAPISKIPIDPVNTYAATGTSTAAYYRYACLTNNTFVLDANLESDAYKYLGTDDKPSKDGGDSYRFEIGSNLRILPATVQIN